MSGRKTITVDELRYQQLLKDEQRLRELQSHLPEILESVRRQTSEDLRERLKPLERRQQELGRVLENVDDAVKKLEERTAHRLEEHQQQMRNAMHSVREEIAEQERRFTEMIKQERLDRQQQVHNLQRQIETIAADQQRRRELACSWIQAAQVMRDFIKGNYRYQKFAPEELEKLERGIQQAQENLEQGVPEAALTQAQQAYHSLADLRLELERLEHQWHLWRNAALESAQEILSLAQHNRLCKAVGLDGKEMDINVEVDWWTNGKLNALEQEVQQLIARIQEDGSPMSIGELREVVEQKMPDLRERLRELVREARLAVLGSQLRINIADLVVQALAEQGFALQDATYEGEDMRGGYVAKVTHLDGSEIVVVVTPKEGSLAQNDLNIHSYDAGWRSEHELQQRAIEIRRALQEKGVQVGEPEAVGDGQPDPAFRDLEQVRKRQPLRRTIPAP